MKSVIGAAVLLALVIAALYVEESSASSGLGFQTLMNPRADSCVGACNSAEQNDEKECPCPATSTRCCRNSDNHCRCCATSSTGTNPPTCCTGWAACK